ncbi:hypothetical protein LSPH24S_05469 [Lysinibacillus sphaericus]
MKTKKEILTMPRSDRRILSNIPDPENVRSLVNRRGASYQTEGDIDPTNVNEIYRLQLLSLRYETAFEVNIKRASIFTSANKMDTRDNKFLKPKDLLLMQKSGFWGCGCQWIPSDVY